MSKRSSVREIVSELGKSYNFSESSLDQTDDRVINLRQT